MLTTSRRFMLIFCALFLVLGTAAVVTWLRGGGERPEPTAWRQPPAINKATYAIEPPDVLFIHAPDLVAKEANQAEDHSLAQVHGQHLVYPDGTINLGSCGTVYVSRLTTDAARRAIEKQLAQYVVEPHVAVEVASANSQAYYVITPQADGSDLLMRFPVTGHDTVLSALAKMPKFDHRKNAQIAIARPGDMGGEDSMIRVTYQELVRDSAAQADFPIMAGDRVFAGLTP